MTKFNVLVIKEGKTFWQRIEAKNYSDAITKTKDKLQSRQDTKVKVLQVDLIEEEEKPTFEEAQHSRILGSKGKY